VRVPQPPRDRHLGDLMKEADREFAASPAQLAALSGRILAAAAPILREREARNRTVWDYAERWSGTLLPLGMLTAVAAAMCLFVLSAQREPTIAPAPGPRVALLGAATNRMSSQKLIDLVVSVDASTPSPRRVAR
jgi:hypothetical protein